MKGGKIVNMMYHVHKSRRDRNEYKISVSEKSGLFRMYLV